jgi:hypothetical protein
LYRKPHSRDIQFDTVGHEFGPVNIDSVWRIRNNEDIDKLIEDADIVRFIMAKRIKWLGHILRKQQTHFLKANIKDDIWSC